MEILRYDRLRAKIAPWNPRAPLAAAEIGEAIRAGAPELTIEHVGSTSIPGCDGKGIIDLLVIYPEGALVAARDHVDAMGFQHQIGPDPWPEERPMRVGAVDFKGERFRVHAHVVQAGSHYHLNDIRFRDRLRADPELMRAYVAEKQRILSGGTMDGTEYTYAKGPFIEQMIASWKEPSAKVQDG